VLYDCGDAIGLREEGQPRIERRWRGIFSMMEWRT
jgi:hypothetical protein